MARHSDNKTIPSRVKSALFLPIIMMALLIALAGCGKVVPKHLRPLSYTAIENLKKHGTNQYQPVMIRVFKQEAIMEIWKRRPADGRYVLVKKYNICQWSGRLGPKLREGDKQAPEGFYHVEPEQMNPKSRYYLSFNIGFPNEFDRANGRTGSFLMVHGGCSSAGCYAINDKQMQELYSLVRDAARGGQKSFQFQAFPFRMTPENIARHWNNPNMGFWLDLKEGYDNFELTRKPPKVNVCNSTYLFNAVNRPELSSISIRDIAVDPLAYGCANFTINSTLKRALQAKAMSDRIKVVRILTKKGADAQQAYAVTGAMLTSSIDRVNSGGITAYADDRASGIVDNQ